MSEHVQKNFKRIEKKYMLSPEQQTKFLELVNPYIVPDKHPEYTITNIYYDTEDFRLIRKSIEKPVYKEKLRVRGYGTPSDSDKVFIEIKKKYESVVYKRRITMSAEKAPLYLSGDSSLSPHSQISSEIEWFQKAYMCTPKVYIGYDRLAFQGIENNELRITFDTNLIWRDYNLDLRQGHYGDFIIPKDKVLMEIKAPENAPLWLCKALSEIHAYPSSFSKYGTCYTKHILTNNNKKEILYIA